MFSMSENVKMLVFDKYIACKVSQAMKTSGCHWLGGSFNKENLEIPDIFREFTDLRREITC